MPDVSLSQAVAREAHAGQTDKLGRDYYAAHLTPIATALRDFGPEAESAGWLHDIIEDTNHTADTLRSAGIAADVVRAVESVTKVEGELYETLIDRACADPIGLLVKLADNTWNLVCGARLAEVDPAEAEELKQRKYLPARKRLLAALEWSEHGPELQTMEHRLRTLERVLANGSATSEP